MTTKEPEKKVTKFPKSELVSSVKYAKSRDILAALLEEEKTYSFEDVDKIIEKFNKAKA